MYMNVNGTEVQDQQILKIIRVMSNKLHETDTIFDSEERIWRGPKRDKKTGSEVSLGRSLLEGLLKHPKLISQVCDNNGKQYTAAEIARMSISVAQHLQDMGVQQEEVIGICASNTEFLAPLVFGTLLSGAVLSTLDPSFDKDGIQHIFSITKPKIMFCDGKVYQMVAESMAEINPGTPIFTMKDHLQGVRQIQEFVSATGREHLFKAKPLKFGSRQTAAILCSSGTTGLPKGVCMSHENLLSPTIFKTTIEDKFLCFSTIYWISGLMSLLQGTLNACTRIITDKPFSAEYFLRLIERYKINLVLLPPSQLAQAVGSPDFKTKDLSSLESCFSGGSSIPFTVVQTFSQKVKNCETIVGYGMSEICGPCSYGPATAPGANGLLMPNIEVKIIDESENKLGVSERGEVCLRTPYKWAGYYLNKDATAAIYDKDRWIHSGDIGYFDEEGYLYIIDRKKDILKYNNFHFFPTELEEIIMRIPDVVEACVCGIPDIISSYLPATAVVKIHGSKLTEEDVAKNVAERMAHFKHLRGGVYFLDSLPKTASGKNVRAKITAIVQALRDQRLACNGSREAQNISDTA